MASEQSSINVNGNYAIHTNGYPIPDQSYSGETMTAASAASDLNNTAAGSGVSGTASGGPEIPPDEVGWYFVEQYYTTLSKEPERLYV